MALILADYHPVPSVVTATLGNGLGGMSSYGLGYLGKGVWIERHLRVEAGRVHRLRGHMARFGRQPSAGVDEGYRDGCPDILSATGCHISDSLSVPIARAENAALKHDKAPAGSTARAWAIGVQQVSKWPVLRDLPR